MATKTEERNKQKDTAGVGSQPPDKKKLDKTLAAIGREVTSKEADLKLISWNPIQSQNAELAQLTGQLSAAEGEKRDNSVQVEEIEVEIQHLGPKVTEKKNEASTLIAGVRHKTEEKIDEAVSKLEVQLTMRQFSAPEERKIRHEMATLTKSKERLRDYLQLKSEIEDMRTRQEGLRKKRNELYRSGSSLREKIGSLKDLVREKRTSIDQLKERRKEAIARKDAIQKEIYDLLQQRRQLLDEFRVAKSLHAQATSKGRERDEENQQAEMRRGERPTRRKFLQDQLPKVRLQYQQEKLTCNALISYIEDLSRSHMFNDDTAFNTTSSVSRPTPADQSVPSSRPGEFLRRKRDEGVEVLVPASSRKKSKKIKRRHTISSKAGKRLNHNTTIFSQFNYIGLDPPYSSLDLLQVSTQLQEKLTFYTSKSQSVLTAAESEAGDSGVGSVVWPDDTDIATPFTVSQEDIPSSSPSPRRSLTDTTNPPSTITLLSPERSLTTDSSLAGQSAVSRMVSAASGSSLTTQSSASSMVAMMMPNGIEE